MLEDGLVQNLVQVGSLNSLFTSGGDFGGEVEKFGDVGAGLGGGEEDGGEGEEVEVALEVVEDGVDFGAGFQIGLRQDDDDAFAGFGDFAGERLVELAVGFGGVDEEGADVGFFDGGEGAEGGELLDADFAAAWFAEAGGVEDFESGAVVFNF